MKENYKDIKAFKERQEHERQEREQGLERRQDEGHAHSPEVIGDRWRQSEQHNQARQKREGQVT